MLKQVTKDYDIQIIGSKEELRFNLVKSVYARVVKKDIETEQKRIDEVIGLIPKFETFIRMYEFRTGKDRKDFSVLERDALINAFTDRFR